MYSSVALASSGEENLQTRDRIGPLPTTRRCRCLPWPRGARCKSRRTFLTGIHCRDQLREYRPGITGKDLWVVCKRSKSLMDPVHPAERLPPFQTPLWRLASRNASELGLGRLCRILGLCINAFEQWPCSSGQGIFWIVRLEDVDGLLNR